MEKISYAIDKPVSQASSAPPKLAVPLHQKLIVYGEMEIDDALLSLKVVNRRQDQHSQRPTLLREYWVAQAYEVEHRLKVVS